MTKKKTPAAASAGSLVLTITSDTTSIEGTAREVAAGLLSFASSLRKSRLEAKRRAGAAMAKAKKRTR